MSEFLQFADKTGSTDRVFSLFRPIRATARNLAAKPQRASAFGRKQAVNFLSGFGRPTFWLFLIKSAFSGSPNSMVSEAHVALRLPDVPDIQLAIWSADGHLVLERRWTVNAASFVS